jgi:hypothetical protein
MEGRGITLKRLSLAVITDSEGMWMVGHDTDPGSDSDGSTKFRLLSRQDWRMARAARRAALRDSPESFLATEPHEASWNDERWRGSSESGLWAVALARVLPAGTVEDRKDRLIRRWQRLTGQLRTDLAQLGRGRNGYRHVAGGDADCDRGVSGEEDELVPKVTAGTPRTRCTGCSRPPCSTSRDRNAG